MFATADHDTGNGEELDRISEQGGTVVNGHVRGPRGATLFATRSVGDFEFLVSTLIIFPANF